MRKDTEIREALGRLKDKRSKDSRQLSGNSLFELIAMIAILEWVLGDNQRLPGM